MNQHPDQIARNNKFRWLTLFLLTNSLVIFAISTKYLKYIEVDPVFSVRIYFTISFLSHFIFLALLPMVVFAPMALFRLPIKYIKLTAIVLALLIDVFLFLDAQIFDLYRFHLNGFVMDLVFGGAASQIFNIPASQFIILIIALFGLTFILVLFSRICSKYVESSNFFIKRIVLPVSLVFLIGSHLIHAWADASAYQPITKISRFYPLYFPLKSPELFEYLGIINKSKIKENKIKYCSGGLKDLKYPQRALEFKDSLNKLNIIFIVLDSWHHNTFGEEVTPNIYKFSKNTQLFLNHFSGSNGTRGGIFSLFYSIPALYWDDMNSTKTPPVFITTLQKSGYDLSIHASSSLASPPFDRTVFASVADLKLGSTGKTSCDRDKSLTNDFLDYLDSLKNIQAPKPFFAFLFYDAPHAIEHPKDFKPRFIPEWPNPKYLNLDNEMDPTPFYNLYRNAICFNDSLVGTVLDKLNRDGFLKNSILIITGDHGQEFNDNHKNYWGHNGNFSKAQLGVPLIFYIPGMQANSYEHNTVHYDIVPTLMNHALGCTNKEEDYSCGINLFNTASRYPFIAGSRENFGIVNQNQITTIFPNGSYSVTDHQLNSLENNHFDSKVAYKLLTSINRFYKTKITKVN